MNEEKESERDRWRTVTESESAEAPIERLKNRKVIGPDDILVEASGYFNQRSKCVLVLTCNNYKGLKVISHTMKLWERVVDIR